MHLGLVTHIGEQEKKYENTLKTFNLVYHSWQKIWELARLQGDEDMLSMMLFSKYLMCKPIHKRLVVFSQA